MAVRKHVESHVDGIKNGEGSRMELEGSTHFSLAGRRCLLQDPAVRLRRSTRWRFVGRDGTQVAPEVFVRSRDVVMRSQTLGMKFKILKRGGESR